MRAVINFDKDIGCYTVDMYEYAPAENRSKWQTLRAFINQGDAMLFRDLINSGNITHDKCVLYMRSYKRGTAVMAMTRRDSGHKLTLTTMKNKSL